MLSSGDQIPSIYKEAIRRYEEITKKKLDDPAVLKMTSVEDLLKEVDQQNDKFSDFRETRHLLFDVLQGAMQPIELVGNLAAGAASTAFPPSSLVFGAVTYLINAAKGVTASYNAIQGLMVTLKEFTVRLNVYSREQISKELGGQLSEILVTLIEIFALSRKAIKGGRLVKFARNVLVGSNDKIQAAVGKLAKLTETEGRLVGAETLTESKRMGRAVDDAAVTVSATNIMVHETGVTVGQTHLKVTAIDEKMGNLILAVNESRDEAKAEQDKSHQKDIKRVLQPSVTALDWYDKINKSRVPGTGDWIRDEDYFKSWIKKDIPILWVSGTPGAGKSYLSSNVISFLRDQHPQGVQHPSHVSVAYFFFKDDNPKTRSFHQALCDIAYQISQNDSVYANYVASTCDSPKDIGTLQSAWRNLFINFFVKKKDISSSVYLIIDGVDEAYEAERQTFLDLVKDINATAGHARIQLAMVGRPQLSDYISEALEADIPTIHVTSRKNSADIVRYIETSIHKSSILKRVSAKLQAEIVEKLSTGAQGMFIWVDLMLKQLLKKKSEPSIRKSLDEAPKGLKEMLRHVLESFSLSLTEDEPEYLNELLAWTTCAERPLKLGELDTILKLQSQEGGGMIYLEGALRKQYASFFILTREDGRSTGELQSMPRNVVDSDDEQENTSQEEGFKDVENLTDFNSSPTTTEVTFCHASIGDFFRDESEGKVSAGDGYPAIGVDFNEAKISVLKRCLELFCDDELVQKPEGGSQSVVSYAFDNWHAHFLAVDPSTASFTQRRAICGLLAKMFGQETFMKRWAGGLTWEFFNEGNVMLIRKWLDNKEVIASLSSEDQEFIRMTSESTVQTFKPLARYIAKQWLEDEWWSPGNCCAIVFAYICLEKGAPLGESLTGLETAADIISVAEWPNLNKTALWHRRLAMALRDKANYNEALEHFTKALELDSTMWIARGGMAMVHLMKGEHGKAIELDKVTELELQQKLMNDPKTTTVTKVNLHTIQERMAQCYEAMEDEESAFECYRNAHRNSAKCDGCTCQVLSRMDAKDLHRDIIDLLKALEEEKSLGKEYTLLTESLWKNPMVELGYYRSVAEAARKTNELDFLTGAYRNAIQAAEKELMVVEASMLENTLATLYYQYTHEEMKAVRIWNKCIETFAGSKEEGAMGYVKLVAAVNLAQHYFRRALDAGIGSRDAEEHVKRIEKLAKKKAQSMDDSSSFISVGYPAIVLGAWYRLIGKQEDANACFRPSIDEAIQILSDDDPDNDMEGLFKLCTVLFAADDDQNAIAITHFLRSYEDSERTKSAVDKQDSSTDDDSNFKPTMSCDGPCHRAIPNYDNIYFCRYCFGDCFCKDCMKLLKDGAMPLNVCSPRHQWLLVPPLRQKVERGKVPIDGAQIDFKDFLKNLKRQWQV